MDDVDAITVTMDQDPQKVMNREVRLAASRARSSIQWNKVYDKDGGRIWQWDFRRFGWKGYKERQYLSLLENPTTLGFEYTKIDAQKQRSSTRLIISFKRGRLAFYRRQTRRIRRFNPILTPLVRYEHVTVEKISEWACAQRNERRLIKLFLTKARANGVKVPRWVKREAKTLQDLVVWTVYPAVQDLARLGFAGWSPETRLITPCLTRPLKASLKLISGHDSKHLMKLALGQPHSIVERLVLLRLLKGVLPLDHLHQVMESERGWDPTQGLNEARPGQDGASWADTRYFLKHFKDRPAMLVRWLTTGEDWLWRDTLNDYARERRRLDFVMPETNDLMELHTIWTRDHRRLVQANSESAVAHRDLKTPQSTLDSGIDGLKVGDYTLIVPKTTAELQDWGNQMNNCIGSYVYRIESGDSIILGLKEGEAMRYGIEMASNALDILTRRDIATHESLIRQFRGRFNEEAPKELVGQVIDAIECHLPTKITLDRQFDPLLA